jgi:hypothetical protein
MTEIDELRAAASAIATAISIAGDDAPPELISAKAEIDAVIGPAVKAASGGS